LRISCYCDACLNSSDLRVGVTTLLNTIQFNSDHNDLNFFSHFKDITVYDQKMTEKSLA